MQNYLSLLGTIDISYIVTMNRAYNYLQYVVVAKFPSSRGTNTTIRVTATNTSGQIYCIGQVRFSLIAMN